MRIWLLGVVLFLSACTGNGFFPAPLFARNFPPPGPPNYQQGMVDGCKSALGAIGYSAYGMMYNDFYYDVNKALTDKVYYRAWKDAWFYCKYEHDKGPE